MSRVILCPKIRELRPLYFYTNILLYSCFLRVCFCSRSNRIFMIFRQTYLTHIIWVLVLSGPRSNGNEGIFYTSQISRTRTSPSDAIQCHPQDTLLRDILLLCRGYSQRILSLTSRAVSIKIMFPYISSNIYLRYMSLSASNQGYSSINFPFEKDTYIHFWSSDLSRYPPHLSNNSQPAPPNVFRIK